MLALATKLHACVMVWTGVAEDFTLDMPEVCMIMICFTLYTEHAIYSASKYYGNALDFHAQLMTNTCTILKTLYNFTSLSVFLLVQYNLCMSVFIQYQRSSNTCAIIVCLTHHRYGHGVDDNDYS